MMISCIFLKLIYLENRRLSQLDLQIVSFIPISGKISRPKMVLIKTDST